MIPRTRLTLALAGALLGLFPCARGAATYDLLVKNGLIMSMAPGQETPFVGYLAVAADCKIAAIGAGAPPPGATATRVVDATGRFVIPGFISSHSHIWQTTNRGLGANVTLFGWIDAFTPYTEATTPDDQYWYTLHGCLDFIKSGITSAYNFTFDGSRWGGYDKPTPPPLPGLWEQPQFKGMIDSGMRFVHSFCIPYADTPAKNHQRVVDFVTFTRGYASNPRFLGLSVQGTVAFVDDPAWAKVEKSYMDEFHIHNQMHMFEPPDGLNQREKFKWMVDAGMVGPQLTFGHFIHTTPEIVKLCAEKGAMVSWQPMSNCRLGSGICDVAMLRMMGMEIGMGTDDQAASDLPDPFENMRMGLYVIRAKYENASVLRPYDVLRFHTLGSARVIHAADRVGSLEQGQLVSQRGRILTQDFDKVSEEVHRRAEAIKARVEAAHPPT
jgi:cytosine/adenosine deaminase-related metal-dependent hydrolase